MDMPALSGLKPHVTELMRRPSGLSAVAGTANPVEGEMLPSGLEGAAGAAPAVTATAGSEKSGFPDKNAPQEKEKKVADAVKNMNDFFQLVQRSLQFSMDEDSGQMVVQIKDLETNKVIRQIPSETVLRLAQEMDKFRGMLFEEKA